MFDIEKLIKEYNLCTTDVIKEEEKCNEGYNPDNYKVDEKNSITLNEIVERFNKFTILFNNKAKKLERININGIEYDINHVHQNPETNYDLIELTNDNSSKVLYLTRRNGIKNYSYIDLDKIITKRNITHTISIEQNIIDAYFELYDEYYEYMEAFLKLRNAFIYGDGYNTLFTKTDKHELLDNVGKFEIALGTDNSVFFKIRYNLGEEPTVDKIKIGNLTNEEITNDDAIYAVKHARVLKKDLPALYNK